MRINFLKIVLLFFSLLNLNACSKEIPCVLYFNSEANIRFRWSKEQNKVLAVDCLQIDDETAKKETWEASYVFDETTLPIKEDEKIEFGREGDCGLKDNQEACLFDKRVGYPAGFNNDWKREFALRSHFYGVVPSNITLSLLFPKPNSFDCYFLRFFEHIALGDCYIWWLTDRNGDNAAKLDYKNWDFKELGTSIRPLFIINIYLWDDYDPLIGDSEEETTMKNKNLYYWTGDYYSFSSSSGYDPYRKVVAGPSFDKPYPFED